MLFPFRTKLKLYFITGLLTIIPLIVIFCLTVFLIKIADKILISPFTVFINRDIPGIKLIILACSVIFSIILIVLVGVFSANILGRRVVSWFEETLVARIPLMNRVYYAAKQLMEFIFIKRKKMFGKVVLVEYPRKGVYSVGFVTAESNSILQTQNPKKTLHLYIPTAFNIASGFFLLVPEDEVIPLDINVEEGLKLVISGGIIVPHTYQ